MMRKIVCIFGIVSVFVLLHTQIHMIEGSANAQTAFPGQLPSDLIFTGKGSPDQSSPALFLVDRNTLEVSPIYTSEDVVNLRAMSWSPDGKLLAVLHVYPKPEGEYGYPTALCIVTVSGNLRTCFDESPPQYFVEAPFLIDFQYEVTWSADGQKAYYVAEDTDQGIRRLIESDTQTGHTVRTIYETRAENDEYIPTIMMWTADLSHVAVGVGFSERSGNLVNLITGEQQDLSSIVISWSGGDVRDRPEGAGYVCNQFSPHGTYLTAIDEYHNRLLVFDKQLEITHIISGLGDENQAKINCPVWNMNEDTIYFVVVPPYENASYIITYSLSDQMITSRIQGYFAPQLEFSPNRTHIAFTEPMVHQGTYQVKVLYPDGATLQFDDEFFRTEYPIWKPTVW